MISLDDAMHEMKYRTSSFQFEAEQDRMARLAAAGHSKGKRVSGSRHVAAQVGDYVARLRCQLQGRFATEPAATAC